MACGDGVGTDSVSEVCRDLFASGAGMGKDSEAARKSTATELAIALCTSCRRLSGSGCAGHHQGEAGLTCDGHVVDDVTRVQESAQVRAAGCARTCSTR
jgi:hypothetical protein